MKREPFRSLAAAVAAAVLFAGVPALARADNSAALNALYVQQQLQQSMQNQLNAQQQSLQTQADLNRLQLRLDVERQSSDLQRLSQQQLLQLLILERTAGTTTKPAKHHKHTKP